MKILFVCEGNKMRSPMAAAFYNAMTGTNDADSAGADPYPMGRPFDVVLEVMDEKNLDLRSCYSKAVTEQMVHDADKIIAFPTSMMPTFVLEDPKTERWDVSDPYYQTGDPLERARHARDAIEDLVRQLVDSAKT